jgi:two-component system, NarL family, sensor kinase
MYLKFNLLVVLLLTCYSAIYSQNQSKTDSLPRIVSSESIDANLINEYEQIAINYSKINKPDSAIVFFNKVLLFHKNNNDILSIAKVSSSISKMYEILGEYSLAEKYLYDAKLNYSILNDTINIISVDKAFADIYGKQRKFDKAISIYERIVLYYQKENNYIELCIVLSNLGVVYEGLEDYNKALISYKKSLEYVDTLSSQTQMAIINMNIGSIYFEIKEYDSVLLYLERSRVYLEKNNNLLPLVHNLLLTGNYYFAINQLQKTKEIYLKAYNIAVKNQLKDYIKMASESLSMVYEDLEDYKNALAYAKIFKTQYDNQINEENIRAQAIAEEGYKYKIKLLLKEKEIDTEKQKKNLLLIIGSLALISLVLIIFYRWRLHKTKLRQVEQNNQIKLQSTKLETQRYERKRVANILHDNLAHVISDTYKKTTGLIEETTEVKSKQTLLQIKESLDFMNKVAKIASYELGFSFILENNLVDEFEKYIRRIQHSYSAKINLQHSEKSQFEDLHEEIKINIFSVFQEMLGNAIKYSKANHISVLLFNDDKNTVLQVEDDGIGFNYNEERHGQGFPNMMERAAKLNGTFTYESEKGFGTKLKFKV